ncbi:AraC family transcriptional regulator [Paenibacillus sp. J5C_2022]|uniref:AraC family transcriptional regulator n=1 Tax=Paenibacillus sp. J5C2022 TaxID=2977129 RepID=UPI0021D31C69|nr:AraC family transcriptional regulator [Paenibacillus sp. J5C2022]MCU6708682.1 AraC family transcriptional regulator [Paenibacillus sp. J5C2022]
MTQAHSLARNLIENLELHLEIVEYHAVSKHWQAYDIVSPFNRFFLITEGECWVKIDGEEFRPRQGQWLLLPAGRKLSFSALPGSALTKYWCHFTATVGELNLFHMLQLPWVIEPDNADVLHSLFDELIVAFACEDWNAPLRVRSLLYEIVMQYFSHCPNQLISWSTPAYMDRVKLAIRHIEEHLHEELSIARLAESAHFHPNYFIRIFKRMTGMTPVHYIQRARIRKAKLLLTSTRQPVGQIAAEIGMDVYYLSRIFKQHTGYSPSEYRGLLEDSPPASNERILPE